MRSKFFIFILVLGAVITVPLCAQEGKNNHVVSFEWITRNLNSLLVRFHNPKRNDYVVKNSPFNYDRPKTQTSSKKRRLGAADHRIKAKTKKADQNYDQIIHEASALNDLDPKLVKAIIKQESQFNPRAVSSKGAAGLMQLMPDNYESMRIDPFDPEQNIHGGTKLLSEYLDRFDGNLTLALAAYNAGPSVVEKVGRVPNITQTKEFVKVVMANYRQYKKQG